MNPAEKNLYWLDDGYESLFDGTSNTFMAAEQHFPHAEHVPAAIEHTAMDSSIPAESHVWLL